ncbi:MAG: hypothetical protein A2902_00485 [Elusimicrobia bacterium RIFCSPLOWO2_01_FULL_64_13]|nr:MAG: hypothetical protein A2636_00880 [Elusimicrobia bacterium RIFCSPHIGHO2_01_FULL_64_10]OGR97350.1 MAG: hypothetical protein A2902_00485 [Elusimicrobia bacterium RIFCSPLOWO2_01_FULL_64_13]
MAKQKKNRDRILIVDDNSEITDVVSMTLDEEGYPCLVANSGEQALSILGNGSGEFSLALIDVKMPGMSGLELLETAMSEYPDMGVMMISGSQDMAQAVEAMRRGALDFISKPFETELLIPRIQKALERVHLERDNREYQKFLEEKVDSRTTALISKHRSLQKLYLSTVEAIVRAIEAKDPYTVGHSKRVSKYCARIAEKLNVPVADLNDIEIAGLLHDVGKIGISDAILAKPSRLSIEEYESIKEHPLISLKIIEPIQELNRVKLFVKHHHEKWDGTGYPDRLKEEGIPVGARILSVADAFDTMWIGRQYHASWDLDTVIEEFKRNRGTQFDPAVVDAFIELVTHDQSAFDLIRQENPPRFSQNGTLRSGS